MKRDHIESFRFGRGRRMTRRGFTLLELLVVLAITVILMGILFIPLSRSIEMVGRGTARVNGIDAVRNAQRRVGRELEQAMEVFDPRPIYAWGFNNWTTLNQRGIPNVGAVPEAYLLQNSVLSFRLPKHRYFCPEFNEYVTPQDIDLVVPPPRPYDDAVALDFHPRHPGSPVELRPLVPLEPDSRVVAYFVALKDPRLRMPVSGGPVTVGDTRPPFYRNIALFGALGNPDLDNPTLNTYALFRVEFELNDPNFANWDEDLNNNGTLDAGEDVDADGVLGPNPNFFYDTRAANQPGGNGQPYCVNWLNLTQKIMDVQTADLVRWLETGGKFVPHSLAQFTPTNLDDEVLQPNRVVGQLSNFGQAAAADLPPFEYTSQFGHLISRVRDAAGRVDDRSRPLPDAVACAPTGGVGQLGPRIQVMEKNLTTGVLAPVFDSANPLLRQRLVSFDWLSGKVSMAVKRRDYAGNLLTRDNFSATVSSYYQAWLADDPSTAFVDGDQVVDPSGLPSGFGSARAQARFAGNALIVPGTEVVQLVDTSVNPPLIEPLRRVGWTGLGATLDRYVAQSDLETSQYTIDYRTGMITLADRDPSYWSNVGPAQTVKLMVRYQFQTNQSTDVVRMSYITKELASVNLGIVEYTRARREVLPFEVTQRVEIRNLRR